VIGLAAVLNGEMLSAVATALAAAVMETEFCTA
jgi:hypothetical protein